MELLSFSAEQNKIYELIIGMITLFSTSMALVNKLYRFLSKGDVQNKKLNTLVFSIDLEEKIKDKLSDKFKEEFLNVKLEEDIFFYKTGIKVNHKMINSYIDLKNRLSNKFTWEKIKEADQYIFFIPVESKIKDKVCTSSEVSDKEPKKVDTSPDVSVQHLYPVAKIVVNTSEKALRNFLIFTPVLIFLFIPYIIFLALVSASKFTPELFVGIFALLALTFLLAFFFSYSLRPINIALQMKKRLDEIEKAKENESK